MSRFILVALLCTWNFVFHGLTCFKLEGTRWGSLLHSVQNLLYVLHLTRIPFLLAPQHLVKCARADLLLSLSLSLSLSLFLCVSLLSLL